MTTAYAFLLRPDPPLSPPSVSTHDRRGAPYKLSFLFPLAPPLRPPVVGPPTSATNGEEAAAQLSLGHRARSSHRSAVHAWDVRGYGSRNHSRMCVAHSGPRLAPLGGFRPAAGRNRERVTGAARPGLGVVGPVDSTSGYARRPNCPSPPHCSALTMPLPADESFVAFRGAGPVDNRTGRCRRTNIGHLADRVRGQLSCSCPDPVDLLRSCWDVRERRRTR